MRGWSARWPAVAAVAVIAQPSPTAPVEVPEPVPGEEVCAVTDPRLVELSGLVAFDDGYAVINDSTVDPARLPIFFLSSACEVIDELSYLPGQPRDPEDLAWDRENNLLWVADTGDNFELTGLEPRPSAALWRIDLDGDRAPVIHRFSYPDGQPRDAEAMVLDGAGTPVIVTKAVGTAELFVPTELRPSSGPEDLVPLEAVGELSLPEPGTDVQHRFGQVARQVIVGGANAPDGSAVVLRSYTDAYEFDVADGDVVAAFTTAEPRITPLPDEPQGEAIAYSPDGQRFLTVSEVPEDDTSGYVPLVLSYAPVAPPPEPEPTPAEEPAAAGGGGGLFNDLQDIINVIAAVGVVGLLLVGAGVFGIVRARRAGSGGTARTAGGTGGAAGATEHAPVTGRARLPGFTGGAPPPAHPEQPASPPPGVYTSSAARPAGTQYRGTEYGGGGGDPDGNGGPDYRDPGYGGTDYGPADYGPAGYGQAGYGQAGYGQAGSAEGQHQPGPEGYPDGGYREPYDQEWPNGHTGQQPGGADYYYSDDPDYPYEFRGRDR